MQGATNFAVFASNAWGMSLCLFTEEDLKAGRVTHEVPLMPGKNKTGDVWHIALPRLDPALLYGYRVFGAHEDVHEESEGQRHDPVSRCGARRALGGRAVAGERGGAGPGRCRRASTCKGQTWRCSEPTQRVLAVAATSAAPWGRRAAALREARSVGSPVWPEAGRPGTPVRPPLPVPRAMPRARLLFRRTAKPGNQAARHAGHAPCPTPPPPGPWAAGPRCVGPIRQGHHERQAAVWGDGPGAWLAAQQGRAGQGRQAWPMAVWAALPCSVLLPAGSSHAQHLRQLLLPAGLCTAPRGAPLVRLHHPLRPGHAPVE